MGFISNTISAVGSFISSAASSIGETIAGFAKDTFKLTTIWAGPIIDPVIVITTLAKIIHAIAEVLGIKSEDDPEILGAKAEQSDKTVEDFDNDVEAYIKYLKEEVKLDKERFNNLTPEEKLGCKDVGMSLETKAVEQKMGVAISPECLDTLAKIQQSGINIDAKALIGIIQILKTEGITNLNDVTEYLDGKGQSDRIKTGEALATALGEGANEKIDQLKDAVRKFEEE